MRVAAIAVSLALVFAAARHQRPTQDLVIGATFLGTPCLGLTAVGSGVEAAFSPFVASTRKALAVEHRNQLADTRKPAQRCFLRSALTTSCA
jgi:hypothetical protein